MTSHTHHTKELAIARWNTEVVPLLPDDLEQQARALGAFHRCREFDSAASLLRGLLAYALVASSLAHLAAWGVLSGVADICAAAWLKRLRAAQPWLAWLLGALLASAPAGWLALPGKRRVKLIDATVVHPVGSTKLGWRLQLSYDLVAGRFTELALLDISQAEALGLMKLDPGDIAVTDAGFGRRMHLAACVEQGADHLTRVYLPTCPLHDLQGKPLDLVAQLARRGRVALELPALVIHQGQRYRVRVLAFPLPRDQEEQARRRLHSTARRKGRTASTTGLTLATWLVLVTTLDGESWPAAEVMQLYRARWQIELAFKRLKQLLGLQRLRCRSAESAIPLLTLSLLGWALSSDLAGELRPALQRAAAPGPSTLPGEWPEQEAVVSTWRVSQLSLEVLRGQVWGGWTAERLRECIPKLVRHLVTHPRQDGRVHQETVIRTRLTGQRLTPPRPQYDAE